MKAALTVKPVPSTAPEMMASNAALHEARALITRNEPLGTGATCADLRIIMGRDARFALIGALAAFVDIR